MKYGRNRAKGWIGTAGMAAVLFLSGCAAKAPARRTPKPSLAFLTDCRVAFEQSLAEGDLDGAGRALERLDGRNVEDTYRWIQLGTARRMEGLFERGRREMAAGDREGLEETRGALRELRTEVYRSEFYWPEGYLQRLEGEYKAFRAEADRFLRETADGKG